MHIVNGFAQKLFSKVIYIEIELKKSLFEVLLL